MKHALALVLLLLVPCSAAAESLPEPAALVPNVRFWMRIYSEVDGDAGLIHDSRHLDVVYEKIRFPENLGQRSRERRVEQAKRRVREALRLLAQGRRSDLTAEQAHVLAAWPEGVSNATLREASQHVRFQLGQADKFRDGLVRAGMWKSHIDATLAQHGVPPELDALPHVESSYNPTAYSRVGAAGMWQFTRSTGRRYLRVDHVVDERMDPFRATEAAARLLRDNYRRLESWPLAITAYNHGVAGMARAVRTLGTRDMGEISERYRSRTFGFASRNFYAEFLAALEVDRNALQYFGPLPSRSPIAYEEIELEHYYAVSSLEQALGVNRVLLREHNPALRPSVWNGAKYVPRGFRLRVPRETAPQPLALALAAVPGDERFGGQHRDTYYKVQRGDTLSTIARRYGVRVTDLVALNNLRSRHSIRAGQVLILPDDARGTAVRLARQDPPPDGVYRVRRGDNLTLIAARFGVSPAALAQENGLRNRNVLYVGQTLRLPGHPVQVASVVPTPVLRPAPEPEPLEEPPAPVPAPTLEPAAAEPEAEVELDVAAETEAEAIAESDAAAVIEALEETGPPAPAPSAEPETVAAQGDGAMGPPSPEPSNYAVTADDRIVVQAEETLGHYAEWLEIRASEIRRLNRMRYETPLVIGRSLRLDFSRVPPEVFEQRRLAYHQALQEEFFSSYVVTGTRTHVLRSGETLWYLAERRFRLPVWLLRQYNPELDFGALPAGARMVIPEVEPRTG